MDLSISSSNLANSDGFDNKRLSNGDFLVRAALLLIFSPTEQLRTIVAKGLSNKCLKSR